MARQTPSNVLVTGGVALFTSAILWNSVPYLWLFAWTAAQLILAAIAYGRWWQGQKKWRNANSNGAGVITGRRSKKFLPLAVGWATMSGAAWGSTTFFLPYLATTEQLAVIIVMVSMASGASSTLAAAPAAAAGYILADPTPAIIYFFLQETHIYSALGFMATIFALALLSSTRTVYGMFLEAARNRRENTRLLDQIRVERETAALSLLQSEQRYSDVVQTVGDMIVSTEAEGAFLFTNPAWRNTLGYSEEDLSAKTFRGILHETWLPQSIERLRGVLAEERSDPVELVLKTRSGDPVWVEGKISPLFENGALVRINGVFRDIGLRKESERTQQEMQRQLQERVTQATAELAQINTSLQQEVHERRQAERAWRISEAQIRLILDSTVEAIYGVDRDGRCTFTNSTCARLLGFEETAELLGEDMHLLCHAKDTDNRVENCPICAVHRADLRAQADDQTFKRRGGGAFPVEYSAGSIIRDGEVIGCVVAFFDITQRRMAEEQLRQSQKMEAIGQLTGGIAHDFNNLLAIIVGNLDLLMESTQTQDARSVGINQKRTKAALNAAERGSALTQRLLAFSRRKMLSPQIIDPGELLNGMSEIMRSTLGGGVTAELRLTEPLWNVLIDPSQFENAVLNLAINARDAMAGNGMLIIELSNASLNAPLHLPRLQLPAGDYVKLRLQDTGIGIPPDIIDKVFEPFFTTKDVGQGTGLGLSMVFGFVEQSAGYIHLDSKAGNGTIISIYLPRASDAAARAEEIATAHLNGEAHSASAAPENIRVLVVEDDQGVCAASVTQIQELGYQVLSAEDGRSALQLFMATPGIDLVYSDVMMPNGMNGVALAENLRKLSPNVKVLLCTGYEGDAYTSGLASNIPILQKPVRKAVLAAKLQEMLKA